MREHREIPYETSRGRFTLYFQGEPGLRDVEWPADMDIHWFHGEQSNSSLSLSDKAILKLVRHVVAGVHPEAEMTRYLTLRGYANSAALLGELVRVDAEGTPHTLALLHARVANQGDAWGWTQDYLKRTLENAALTGESQADYEEELRGYATVAGAIGRRLAQLHAVFAQPSEDPAFMPERARASDAKAWAKDIRNMFSKALKSCAAAQDSLSEPASSHLSELQENSNALLAEVDRRAQLSADSLRTRIHGDFHLGQVLIAQNDFYLLDFEGEPSRSLAERRAKYAAFKDVAGMLRSFEYAGWAALFARDGHEPDTFVKLEPVVDTWRSCVQESFLGSYFETVNDSLSCPPDRDDAMALLNLFLLEKALYEINYEAANRPSWLRIPIAGLNRLLNSLAAVKG
jgi:maltose alpha-D-glucosyltransferase/alpha-amylase